MKETWRKKKTRKENHSTKKQAEKKIHVEVFNNRDVSSPKASGSTLNDPENNNCHKKKADWILYQVCGRWLHELRAFHRTMCNDCGREKDRDKKSLYGNIRSAAFLPCALASILHPKEEMDNQEALVFYYLS